MATCETCRFFLEEIPQTFCRRFPPQLTIIPVPTQGIRGPSLQLQSVAGFPTASKEGWCGEWATKLQLKALS